MDNTPPPVQSTPPQIPSSLPSAPKRTKLKGLFLLEVGIFEVGFVLILLSLIFGVLNYFSILNLSKALPVLSFLPHQSQPMKPTPIPIPTGPFLYDKTSAYSLLEQYTKETLTDDFLPKPASASADPFLFVDNENVFTSPWNLTTPTFVSVTASLIYVPETNTPSQYKVFLQSDIQPFVQFPAASSEKIAQQAAAQVLRDDLSKAIWKCSQDVCFIQNETEKGLKTYIIKITRDISTAGIFFVGACLSPLNPLAKAADTSCIPN